MDTRTAAVPKGLIQIAVENKVGSDIMLLYENVGSLCSFVPLISRWFLER